MVAAQNATQRSLASTQEPASPTEKPISKDQIAEALGSKDPAWFRQTADRGQGSAAYRRNQVEDDDRLDMTSMKTSLPGMSPDSARADMGPVAGLSASSSQASLASPLPLNPPKYDGPSDDRKPAEPASPTGRISPTRSGSPTKGMGGFVQSAMMKRSDSVKRWSVTSPPGLTRADSIASNRGPFDRSAALNGPRPQSIIREKSTTPVSSRPVSRHGETQPEQDSVTRPAAPVLDTTVANQQTSLEEAEQPKLPTSPSKTMDPRRWSPTKASWLETALNKPESPKLPSKPGTPSQPTWMADLAKKQSEGDSTRSGAYSHKHQVSIGGLMRSSPMGGGAKPNATGLGGIYSPPPGGNRPLPGHNVKLSISKNSTSPEPDRHEEDNQPQDMEEQPDQPAVKSAVTSPPPLKPKPETPPKKDFRSNLKQRPVNSTADSSNEPEFKNVFGNLRRTKTQNYVAPDVLKANITRGKAALNVTGGPKKSERVDEFKDAILKKKDDFKKAQAEGKGVTRSAASSVTDPVPEGLARRAELGRSSTIARRNLSSETSDEIVPKKGASPKPSPKPKHISSRVDSLPGAEKVSLPEPDTLKRVTTEPMAPEKESDRQALPSLQKETSAPSRLQQGRGGSGKLADRFNPALAGMLARGPPPMSSGGSSKPESSAPAGLGISAQSEETTAPGPQLTHMTKNRARGPKRKAPKSSTSASTVATGEPKDESKSASSTEVPLITKARSEQERSGLMASKPESAASSSPSYSVQQQVAARAAMGSKPAPIRPGDSSPEPPQESMQPKPLATRRLPSHPEKPSERPISPIRPHKTGDAGSQPGSPKKLNMNRLSKFLDDSSVGIERADSPKEPIKLTHQRTGSRSPVKLSNRSQYEPAPLSPVKVDREPIASAESTASKFGGSAARSPPIKPKPTFDRPLPEPTSVSQAAPRALPSPLAASTKPSRPIESPVPSPTKVSAEVSSLLKDFFGPDQSRQAYKVDPAELLMSRQQTDAKIKNSRVQMYQLTGDGKKIPVPAHFERVLFDQEMYVCAHEYTNRVGKQTFEVYFWIGDDVPQSTAEDAQLFASREARSLGGKLIKLKQGKETSEFVQALGGVIIIRRGSGSRHDTLAPSMLCGRRYLGEVVFDEVDFSSSSLCAGFPYLISQGGNCYLWKGKGCDVDEHSCAKLVGMEMALTGELEEVTDGSEPDSFWRMLENGSKPHSADHWRLKPNYAKYGSRLFCSDADSRQQVS